MLSERYFGLYLGAKVETPHGIGLLESSGIYGISEVGFKPPIVPIGEYKAYDEMPCGLTEMTLLLIPINELDISKHPILLDISKKICPDKTIEHFELAHKSDKSYIVAGRGPMTSCDLYFKYDKHTIIDVGYFNDDKSVSLYTENIATIFEMLIDCYVDVFGLIENNLAKNIHEVIR